MSWIRIFQTLQTGDEEEQYQAVREARVSVTAADPPIRGLVDAGIVPVLVGFLDHQSIRVQQEAIWVLINVAFGTSEEATSIISAGGVPKLINLMRSPDSKIANQSVWVLSNLCGDGNKLRNKVIECGVIDVLRDLLERRDIAMSFVQSLIWLSLNISRHSRVPLHLIQPLFNPLWNLISRYDDRKILVDTIWFFTNLVTFNITLNENLVLQILSRTRHLLVSSNNFVIEAVLRLVSAISISRSFVQSEQIIKTGILPQLIELITHHNANISHLSTLCCRNLVIFASHIRQLMNNGILSALLSLFKEEKFSWKAQREGVWLIRSIYMRGSHEQALRINENIEFLSVLFNLLKSKEVQIVKAMLNLLRFIKDFPFPSRMIDFTQYKERLTACGLLEGLEGLLDHADEEIHQNVLDVAEIIYPEILPYYPEEIGLSEE